MMFDLSIGDYIALGVALSGAVTALVLLPSRWRQARLEHTKTESDTGVQELTSAAGAIDAAARSLKIMLDAVPGTNTVPEHQVASVIDATAQAMLAILNTLPGRVFEVEKALPLMQADLEELRTQVAGLSKRPTL